MPHYSGSDIRSSRILRNCPRSLLIATYWLLGTEISGAQNSNVGSGKFYRLAVPESSENKTGKQKKGIFSTSLVKISQLVATQENGDWADWAELEFLCFSPVKWTRTASGNYITGFLCRIQRHRVWMKRKTRDKNAQLSLWDIMSPFPVSQVEFRQRDAYKDPISRIIRKNDTMIVQPITKMLMLAKVEDEIIVPGTAEI